jgi:hypothetical protein
VFTQHLQNGKLPHYTIKLGIRHALYLNFGLSLHDALQFLMATGRDEGGPTGLVDEGHLEALVLSQCLNALEGQLRPLLGLD